METEPVLPLTDEELAETKRGHEGMDAPFNTPRFCRRCSHFWPCPTIRLVSEIERVRTQGDEGFMPGWCCPKDYCCIQFVGDEPCPSGW